MSANAPYQPRLSVWGHIWRTLLMLMISAVVAIEPYGALWDDGRWWIPFDLGIGVVAFGLVLLRRRFPMVVLIVLSALSVISSAAAGPVCLAIVSLATRRVWWELVLGSVLAVAAAETFFRVMPGAANPGEPIWLSVSANVAVTVAMVAWGMYVGSRRELLWTLRQRAERAESERDLRMSKAQADERARIAREMHDVLAHRISQVAMHAGALSFRTDLEPDALRAGIGEVQQRANEALTDLRNVLGVLRDPTTGEITHRPQPTYGDLPALAAEASAAGARIEVRDEVVGVPSTPVGRTLYRIVQEGITNAHKHARGALLTVEITGDPESGVTVRMRNPYGFGSPGAPGSGLGLVGLHERVDLAGGTMTHGREGDLFIVQVWLPWSP